MTQSRCAASVVGDHHVVAVQPILETAGLMGHGMQHAAWPPSALPSKSPALSLLALARSHHARVGNCHQDGCADKSLPKIVISGRPNHERAQEDEAATITRPRDRERTPRSIHPV